jgi:hypothetical protein
MEYGIIRDSNLLGFIVNPESGADGKKLNDHYLPLAIFGFFPAKVTLQNGPIKRGDPLTSSNTPGSRGARDLRERCVIRQLLKAFEECIAT